MYATINSNPFMHIISLHGSINPSSTISHVIIAIINPNNSILKTNNTLYDNGFNLYFFSIFFSNTINPNVIIVAIKSVIENNTISFISEENIIPIYTKRFSKIEYIVANFISLLYFLFSFMPPLI